MKILHLSTFIFKKNCTNAIFYLTSNCTYAILLLKTGYQMQLTYKNQQLASQGGRIIHRSPVVSTARSPGSLNEMNLVSRVVASRLTGHEAKIQGNRTRTLAVTVKVREDSIGHTAILDPGIYVKVGNNGTGSGSVLEKRSMAHGRKIKSGLSSLRTCLKTNGLVGGRSNHLNLKMNLAGEEWLATRIGGGCGWLVLVVMVACQTGPDHEPSRKSAQSRVVLLGKSISADQQATPGPHKF